MESFKPTYEKVCNGSTNPNLRDLEHEEHYNGKNRNTEPFVSKNGIDLITEVLVLGQNLTGFYVFNDLVYKIKTLTVSSFNNCLIGKIDIALNVRSALSIVSMSNCSFNNRFQTICRSGNGVYNRATKLSGKSLCIDLSTFLFIKVALVQSHNNGNTKLQKLSSEEKATAQIGSINNVDDNIGIFLLHVGTGDALFTGEGRHGVCAGKVNSDKLRTTCIRLFNGVFFFVYGNTSPVADLFITAGQSIVHCGLT